MGNACTAARRQEQGQVGCGRRGMRQGRPLGCTMRDLLGALSCFGLDLVVSRLGLGLFVYGLGMRFRARPLLCDTRSTCPTAVDKRPHPPRRPSRASALSRAAALASPSCATTLRCQRYGQSAVRFQGRGCQSKNQDDSFWEYAFWKQLMTQPST